ncbi:MAG: Ldh family oxidoreductase [Clostridia bacterium]
MANIRLTQQQSIAYVTHLLTALKLPEQQAAVVADHLTMAEMRGLASHGLSRIPFYTNKLKFGGYKADPSMCVLRQSASSALIDADDAFGVVSGCYAMRMALDKARHTGCASVSVTHANHIGFLAYYTMMAAQENMIGLAICNAGAATSIWGTSERVLGTNPLSVAVPAQRHWPVVFDAATSVVAQGKVAVASIEGKPIPDNWAFDSAGRPTTSAQEALKGAMRPFGDYKGSGLAMLISLVSAGLNGVAFDMEPENLRRIKDSSAGSDLGDFFMAVDISAFADVSLFKDRVDTFIELVKGFAPAPGFGEILVPGEAEFRASERAQRDGFTIGANLFGALREIGMASGLASEWDEWTVEGEGDVT